DWLSRQRLGTHAEPMRMKDVLECMIRAYEIQGTLALENAFNRVGIDHVILVRVASAAVITRMLGGTKDQVMNAVAQAWLDGGPLRTYRHAPNTGSRKSWAAGDATSRSVRHALWSVAGEMGYPTVLTAPTWGFEDSLFLGNPIKLARKLDCYVMENILFKVSFPAEFHGQTAVEAAFQLHPQVKGRWDKISRIRIETHESAIRIITKSGPLHNPADRDHCLQYMVAIALLHGELTADHYEHDAAADPRIDVLREKMDVAEDPDFSADYLDPDKRSIANAIQIFFNDGSSTDRIVLEYPLGHRRRRTEALPLVVEKFIANAQTQLSRDKVNRLVTTFQESAQFDQLTVPDFVDMTIA
ncbi:MAG: bifunctional 2-methylcitrate dehydratase/aconitate hydratase, partial [Planctomycetes bacterium]|nr:bifunctional 2-methylcitrate dehydratase/aconitate hydratase [Planctomycetota bacterium]